MVDAISGGDVYFARADPDTPIPLAALPRKHDIRKISGMTWSGLPVGADMGVMHVAAPPIQRQHEEPVCGSCLVLDGEETCQIAQPQCSRRPRRWALLPCDLARRTGCFAKKGVAVEGSAWLERDEAGAPRRRRR